MKRLLLASCLLAASAAANAMLVLRPNTVAAPESGEASVMLGPHRLKVAKALLRDGAQGAGGRLDRLDLVMRPDDFAPLPALDARNPESAPPERLTLVLTPVDDRLSAIDMFGKVYARYLSGDTLPSPAGLMRRVFREKTPYEDRELFLGVGAGRTFVALCPLPDRQESEPCTTSFRLNGLDMELRFPAARLPQWRRMSEQAFALLETMIEDSPGAQRVALPPEG